MKTKAYKMREKMARYMFNAFLFYDVVAQIYFDRCDGIWLVYPITKTKRNKLPDIIDFVSGYLGVDLVLTLEDHDDCTLMWDCIKELKTLSREERWKKTVKYPDKTEKFYLVETDTDVFGLYRNLDEAKTLKMHLEIVLGKEVYIRKIN